MAYLDHAATTPMLPEALEAMTDELARTGNPSSLHAAGRRARRVVEESRETLAAALGARPSEVVFTGRRHRGRQPRGQGPVLGPARQADPRRVRVLASAVEHHAVLDPVAWLGDHEGADGRVAAGRPLRPGRTRRPSPTRSRATPTTSRWSRSCGPTTRSAPSSPSARSSRSRTATASPSTPTPCRPLASCPSTSPPPASTR